MTQCAEFVPDAMYDFVQWCVNEKAYRNVTCCSDDDVLKNNLKTTAICHNIIAQSQHVFTTITLGLASQVHHQMGSKTMINLLYSLGHCVSYDEVERFLTSAALDQGNDSDNVYIPKTFKNLRTVDGSPANDAANDNFDQNEATFDGKSTTHVMAAVLFHRGNPLCDGHSIPR